MKRRTILQFTLLLLTVWFISCENKTSTDEKGQYTINKDTIHVLNDSILGTKIKVSEVQVLPFHREVITAGMVQPIPTQFAYVAPPFSGRVVKSYIKLGQRVKKNTPLFEISSTEFMSVQKDFFQARSAKDLAEKELKRKNGLAEITSKRELEEAQNSFQIAEKEYENAVAALNVFQVDINDVVLGAPLVVYSPISGQVITNNIVIGQYITNESDPIATIADLSQVWIMAQVKEKDIRYIHKGDEMDMHIAAYPDADIKGTVFHIGGAVDEDTRSTKVLSICDNQDELLKIGMYTTIHFLDKASEQIHIPEKSLLQGEKGSYVLLETQPNTYVRTPVEVEVTKNGQAIITKGLSAGQRIISEGGYYLQ
mgnify:CR=1 FL=1